MDMELEEAQSLTVDDLRAKFRNGRLADLRRGPIPQTLYRPPELPVSAFIASDAQQSEPEARIVLVR
jgi:hypothetical protein